MTGAATWDSSTPSVATVSNAPGSHGLAASLVAGSTAISATYAGLTAQSTLTVTAPVVAVTVTPANASLPLGTSQQVSRDGGIQRRIDTERHVGCQLDHVQPCRGHRGQRFGYQGAGDQCRDWLHRHRRAYQTFFGFASVAVTAPALTSIGVAPVNPSLTLGATQQFVATGTYTNGTSQNITASVTWASSDTAVATISNAAGSHGHATSVGQGSSVVSAAAGAISGSTTLTVTAAALTSLTVSPANPTVALGGMTQFTAIAGYSNGTSVDVSAQVLWSSSNPAVATISNAPGSYGLATSVTQGTATITAMFETFSGSSVLTVGPPIFRRSRSVPPTARWSLATTGSSSPPATTPMGPRKT